MTIKHWPEGERPREKLLMKGPQALSDAELLAIFLRTGVAGKSAVEMARELLQQFGSLNHLLGASQNEFCSSHGLGVAKYTQLQAVVEMSRRYLEEEVAQVSVVDSPGKARRLLSSHLKHRKQEVFACLFLNQHHHVIQYEELFFGTVNAASVYPREVVKRALAHNAVGVILAHNHPSGISTPSQDDIELTQLLVKALALIDVNVLDHIVVASRGESAFTDLGLIR